jgi:peptidyl-prolyl cis-trans isomerase A (cyclophilin A)
MGAAAPAASAGICTESESNPLVRFETNLGNFEILLCMVDVEATVQSFLGYVADGSYTDTGFIHRRTRSNEGIDVIQGGGFYIEDSLVEDVCPSGTCTMIDLETRENLPNVRTTIAMARTSDINSATSQWFINVNDNESLDDLYAVFGEVTSGMETVDLIGEQGIWNLNGSSGGPFGTVPLIDFPDDDEASVLDYLVYVTNISVVPEPAVAFQQLGALAVLAYLRRRLRSSY